MNTSRRSLAAEALRKSLDVRAMTGRDLKGPLCIYGLCEDLKVRVRFVEISMEGTYLKGSPPTILLSSLRPLPRRGFTCAHELGHHVFGHGTTIDHLLEEADRQLPFHPREFMVDAFAGCLLMPTVGVRRALAMRGWRPETAAPLHLYTLACNFGVGYETLIRHMCHALSMLPRPRAETLLKASPKTIRAELLGRPTPEPLIVADGHWEMPTLDAEVGHLLLLPPGTVAEGDLLIPEAEPPHGRLLRATRPGIVRVLLGGTKAIFVRVSRHQYAGLSQYRHLEEADDDV